MKTLLYIFTLLACCVLITISSCKKDNKCDGVNCGTQGTCNEDTGKCDCNEGWEGTLCDSVIITSICDTINCGENGICNEVTGMCDCQEGWEGTLCDSVITTSICDTINCGENGICNEVTEMCDCNEGWTGVLCEVKLPDCLDLDCGPNGTCIIDNGIAICICDQATNGDLLFSGENCENCIAFGGPCPKNSHCTLLGCECNEGYIVNSNGTECILSEPEENGNAEMYWGEYLQSDIDCTDTSIDPSSLTDYATVVISQNNGIDNELLFNNLSGLGDDVVIALRNDPTRFEIPAQTTTSGHYFEGLTIGTFNVFDIDTLIAMQYTLTPLGGSPDTCNFTTLRKIN